MHDINDVVNLTMEKWAESVEYRGGSQRGKLSERKLQEHEGNSQQ